jgi:hypothetical protein
MALISFNGYYSLDAAAGAFFAIDTNMFYKRFSSAVNETFFEVSLLISLDGTTSYRFPFTGSFDGTILTQQSGELGIELTLNRTVGGGHTVTCSGTIALPGEAPLAVSGATYNNPIPANLFAGKYCVPLYLGTGELDETAVKVMQIEDDFQVLYDFGSNDGELQPVQAYVYNMNMYFFSFPQGDDLVHLIMGTSAANGFACNNMTIDSSTKVTSRSLTTIPFPDQEKPGIPEISSAELAAYSGYYQVPVIDPRAFISIQGEYVAIDGILDIYSVIIGVSLDGKTAKKYYFDGSEMTFQDNTLKMPNQAIEITFEREYVAAQRSLVTITGTIADHQDITGYTLFNPVPLRAFGGIPMTNSEGDSLTVVSDSEVIYNGTKMDNIMYVPIMYILASPWDQPTMVMSFGTEGVHGNACIVIDQSGTTAVHAIPGES